MSFVTYRSVTLLMSQFMNLLKNRKSLVSIHWLAKTAKQMTICCDNFFRIVRSSHRRCSVKKGVPKNFKFHRKAPVLESLFNRITGLQVCHFIKKTLQHKCFPVKFGKFLRTPILGNIYG